MYNGLEQEQTRTRAPIKGLAGWSSDPSQPNTANERPTRANILPQSISSTLDFASLRTAQAKHHTDDIAKEGSERGSRSLSWVIVGIANRQSGSLVIRVAAKELVLRGNACLVFHIPNSLFAVSGEKLACHPLLSRSGDIVADKIPSCARDGLRI